MRLLAFLICCTFFAGAVRAEQIYVNANTLFPGGYDTFTGSPIGLILDDYDLGNISAEFSGVTMDITVGFLDPLEPGRIQIRPEGRFRLQTTDAFMQFDFSQPIDMALGTRQDGVNGFGGFAVYTTNEKDTFISSGSLSFDVFNPSPDVTFAGNEVFNSSGTTDGVKYAVSSFTDSFRWEHTDLSVPEFDVQDLGFYIGAAAVPEPSAFGLWLVFAGFLMSVRCRRG